MEDPPEIAKQNLDENLILFENIGPVRHFRVSGWPRGDVLFKVALDFRIFDIAAECGPLRLKQETVEEMVPSNLACR